MSPPSSRPPTGVPQSGGNAKYAIVAVVLLLGAGGLFYMRSSRPDEPPPPPAPMPSTSASSAATNNPLLDDIPPPPPPDITPEGGKPNVVYVPGQPGGGCAGTCAGKPPAELAQALQMRGNQARRCYNAALSQDPSIKGHVSIAVRVGPAGNVCSATVASNDMGSPGVANCAAAAFRNGTYPAPAGGCVDATIPLAFVPQGGQ
jgi:hypothetical protein